MGNTSFDFLFKYWPKLFKIFRIKIWTFLFQICFWNEFWTLGSGQTENTQIRVFAYFPVDDFPKSKIEYKSRFEMKMSLFLFSIFFVKSFDQYYKKSKMDFPLYFLNCNFKMT